MLVKVYFERLRATDNVTFIKARARKDANSPYYHAEYQTTPTNIVASWKESSIMNYIILNDNQSQIEWLSGGYLNDTRCMLIISEEDFALLYPSEEQRQSMIEYIDSKLK